MCVREAPLAAVLLLASAASSAAFSVGLLHGLPKTGPPSTCPVSTHSFGLRGPRTILGGASTPFLRRTFQSNAQAGSVSLRMSVSSEDEDSEEEVVVKDPDTGKTIECYVDQDVTIDGKPYYIVYPCDTPVVIAYVDKEGDEEELIPVPEEDIPRVFAGAYKACADLDAELVDSAVVLTLQGYEDDTEDEDELGEAGDDEEFVRVITSYDENGVEYLITEPLEPVLIITKPDKSTEGSGRQTLACLPEAELLSVMPEVEKLLEARFSEEEDD